ncbi:MAG: ribbon-helix-helix protein, CopG family [Deltaproteobacteria bacterium]|nr:ribbon-helix-helix protein, CopG family [Deltaproteobacteria bacterium]
MPKGAAVTVRIPADLKRRLQARARREHRSLSGQIAAVLERSVVDEPVRAPGRLLGLYEGKAVPTEADFAEVRALLWGSLGRRKARGGP